MGESAGSGAFFLSGHDRRAEAAVVKVEYGTVPICSSLTATGQAARAQPTSYGSFSREATNTSSFCPVADGSKGAGVRQPGKPLHSAYVRALLPKLASRAGIEKRVHAHGLRHSHATELVQAGVPLHVIAGQLGHASTATTDAYLAKLMPSERIKALRAAGWSLEAPESV